MGKETVETLSCNAYMDMYGYPTLCPSNRFEPKRNKKDIWLDKLGKDVGIFDTQRGREIWVDEKFSTSNLNGEKAKLEYLSVALDVKGDIRHGLLTEPDFHKYSCNIWLFGIPYGEGINNITSMEVYACVCNKLRKEIEGRIGLSMEDLFRKGKEMLESDISNIPLKRGFLLDKKNGSVDLSFPLDIVTGFHGFC